MPPRADCAPDFVYLQVGADASLPPVLQLDPDRVYAVEYLFAEGNDRPMSRWGHSMLRLVICAPGRAHGPDCRFDLQHHQVLSFRAFIDDVQISSWRGLTGSYPSRLYVLPLAQVIEEYTKVELRGLQSIPLQLGPAEIADLMERTARLHWSYDGDITSSATTAPWKPSSCCTTACRGSLASDLSSISPTGLLRRLQHAGIADATVLDDRDEALRLGYHFEALSTRYQAMFDVARQALPLPRTRVQDWLDLDPSERAPWLERADLRAGAALLLLEQAALRRQQQLARDELKRRFFGSDAAQLADRADALDRRAGHPAAGRLPQPPGDAAGRTLATACRSPLSVRHSHRRAIDVQRSGDSRATRCGARPAGGWLRNGKLRWMGPRPTSRRSAGTCGACIRNKEVCSWSESKGTDLSINRDRADRVGN